MVASMWQLAQPNWPWKAKRALKKRRSPRRSGVSVVRAAEGDGGGELACACVDDADRVVEAIGDVEARAIRGEGERFGVAADGDAGDDVAGGGGQVVGE